jgi:hypothetical protein
VVESIDILFVAKDRIRQKQVNGACGSYQNKGEAEMASGNVLDVSTFSVRL